MKRTKGTKAIKFFEFPHVGRPARFAFWGAICTMKRTKGTKAIKFFDFPCVGRPARVATGQSFSDYIRHSASRAARPTREKGVQHSIASPPLRCAIFSSRLEGQSSDCPGRAFTAVRTIPAPNTFGAICAKRRGKWTFPVSRRGVSL